MLKNKLLAAISVSAVAFSAAAADFTPSSNVSLVSDYLYRGISQSGAHPAIQGGFDLAHASGLYIGAWGSSISWLGDAGVASDAGLELDTYGGYKGTAGDWSYDVGFLRYNYPGNYAAGATKADTNEIYGLVGYSIVTLKYSYSLGDTFGVPDAKGTSYIDLSANYTVGDSGVTLGAHYGKQTYKGSSAKYQAAVVSGDPTYSDYKLSVAKDFSGYVLGLAYSNTNASAFYTSLQGKKLGKGTAILSLSRTF